MKPTGSRAEVFHGTAARTSGGLTKKDLTLSKSGEIVSLAKQKQAMKMRTNPLSKFITKAKKSKGKKFTPMPSSGSAYQKLLK